MTGVHTYFDDGAMLRGTAITRLILTASVSALSLCLSAGALAEEGNQNNVRKSNAWSTQTLTIAPKALNLDMSSLDKVMPSLSIDYDLIGGVLNESNSLQGSLLGEGASTFLNLDDNGSLCLRTSDDCEKNDRIGLGYSRNFEKSASQGLDLQLTPRAGVTFDDESSSALVGALVKIGDNLQRDQEINPNTWYFFAGADAQAMTYTPGGNNTNIGHGGLALRDQIIVGDAQAGLAYRLGAADLSLTYLRREARAENYKFEEDAAALSFTWRR